MKKGWLLYFDHACLKSRLPSGKAIQTELKGCDKNTVKKDWLLYFDQACLDFEGQRLSGQKRSYYFFSFFLVREAIVFVF